MTKQKKFDLIVFDWDGTLMDSEAKIVRCFEAAAADVGADYPGAQAVRDIIGLGLAEAMDVLFPTANATVRSALVERYREHFLHLDQTDMPLFPGVDEGLQNLADAGYTLAIATGKARRGLNRVLNETGIGNLFKATRCADETLSKPHPKMLLDILDETGVPADRALMVGDTVYDIQMANRADIGALAVSYGVQQRERLLAENPLGCVDSFESVCGWIR
jgi:phosphoglycolate phosphatase